MNNGFLSTPIQLQRGLRQGCPLSLPLYVIQGEVATININNQNIKGIKIPNNNKEIISQYAGDSYFLLAEQQLVQFEINYFEKLKKNNKLNHKLRKNQSTTYKHRSNFLLTKT